MRYFKALAIAPLTAPLLYWMASVLVGIADLDRTVAPRSAAEGLSVILLVGGPVSYLAALVAAAPAIVMLRRWGASAVPGVLAVGAVVGAVTAIVLGPYLRGELFSVILTPGRVPASAVRRRGVLLTALADCGRRLIVDFQATLDSSFPSVVLEVFMFSKAAVAALSVVLCVSLSAQEKKAAGTKRA